LIERAAPAPEYFVGSSGVRLAYRFRQGRGANIVFLPGYASDMDGAKALAVANWAAKNGHSMLRLDYSGCGLSDGYFEDGTLTRWRRDVLDVMDHCFAGPFILVGSSMGGWLALLIALERRLRLKALVTIAGAPDFTEWGFTPNEKLTLIREGRLEQHNPYGSMPTRTLRGFWESGQDHLILNRPIELHCPVRILHGQCDEDVPWHTALRIAEQVRSVDVQVHLVKDGDHRLSRPQDLALLVRTIAGLLDG
jgi:pimeloyl-ACP methyl ester carboxylesterase